MPVNTCSAVRYGLSLESEPRSGCSSNSSLFRERDTRYHDRNRKLLDPGSAYQSIALHLSSLVSLLNMVS